MSNYNYFLKRFLLTDNHRNQLEEAFPIMDKLENRKAPLSNAELRYFLSEAHKNPVIEYFLINRYGKNTGYFYTEAQVDIIIDYFNEKNDARSLASILMRDDLSTKNISRILFLCEAMGIKIGALLKEQKVNSNVIDYLFDHKMSEMKNMEYAPFEVCTSREVGKFCNEMMDNGMDDENFALAVTNNRYLPTAVRDRAFDLGCDVTKIKEFTHHTGHQTYISAADCGFELDYKFHNAVTIDKAMKVIKENIDKLPAECIVDLILRISETKKNEYLLTKIAEIRQEPVVVSALLDLKNDKINDILKKQREPTETAYIHFVTDGITSRSEAKEIFLKMLWYRNGCDKNLCNYWIDKNDQEMLKAMLMRYDLPRDVMNNIRKVAGKEVKAIIKIRDNLISSGIADIDIINSYRFFIIKTMKIDDKMSNFASRWFMLNKRPIISHEPATKYLISAIDYEIKNSQHPEALMSLMSSLKKLKERYAEESFLSGRKIRCFKGLRDGYTFSVDSIKEYDNIRYQSSAENIRKIDNEKVLSLLHEEMIEKIAEIFSDENMAEVDYVLYKSEKVYKDIYEQLQMIQEKNRECKRNEPLTAEQKSLVEVLVAEATGR